MRFQIAIIIPVIAIVLLLIVLPEILSFLYVNRRSLHNIMHGECTHAGHLTKRGLLILTVLIPMHYVVSSRYRDTDDRSIYIYIETETV